MIGLVMGTRVRIPGLPLSRMSPSRAATALSSLFHFQERFIEGLVYVEVSLWVPWLGEYFPHPDRLG